MGAHTDYCKDLALSKLMMQVTESTQIMVYTAEIQRGLIPKKLWFGRQDFLSNIAMCGIYVQFQWGNCQSSHVMSLMIPTHKPRTPC